MRISFLPKDLEQNENARNEFVIPIYEQDSDIILFHFLVRDEYDIVPIYHRKWNKIILLSCS